MIRLKTLLWSGVVISVVLAVVDTLVLLELAPLWSEESIGIHGWPFVNVASLGCSVMGALIVSAYTRHPVGWILSVVGLTTSISLVTESYANWFFDGGPGTERLANISGWISAVLGGTFALGALTVMFLLLPDGHLLSSRWRYAVAATVGGYALFMVGLSMEPPELAVGRGDPSVGTELADVLGTGGGLLIAALLVASVVCMLIRLRRAEGEARQQLRLVAVGAAAVAAGLVVVIVGQPIAGGEQTAVTSVPLFVAYVLLLACIALAVLKYRLYDVDQFINRAVLLTSATLIVACGYVVVVVGIGAALGDRTEGFWPSLIAIAVVAMAFQPLRRWVVRFADRLAYGDRAAPYDALAAFSRAVGQRPAPDDLLPAVAEAAGRAVRAQTSVAQLDLAQAAPHRATWPPPGAYPIDIDGGAPPVVVPVADSAGALGSVTVQLGPGRSLRPQETRLLNDLADQAALAFRNARLEVELAAHVETLSVHTEQLAASRRRIIESADAGRRRLEAAISRDVIPILAVLRADIDEASSRPGAQDNHLVDDATRALESLRELTRGIYPTMLTRSGLGPALTSYFARQDRRGELHVDESAADRRFSERVEAAVYFCCVEAIANAHGPVDVHLAVVDAHVQLGVAGAMSATLDRRAMADRVDVCGELRWAEGDEALGFRVVLPVDGRRAPASAT